MSTSTCSSPSSITNTSSAGGYFGQQTSKSALPSRSNSYILKRNNSENKWNVIQPSPNTPNPSTTTKSSTPGIIAPSTITIPSSSSSHPNSTSIPDVKITKPLKEFDFKPSSMTTPSVSPPTSFKPVMPQFSPNMLHTQSSPKFLNAKELNVKETNSVNEFKEFITEHNQGEEDVVVIDLRSFNQYNTSRVMDSLNICIPSTLLKRNSFHLSNIFKTMISSQEKYLQSLLLNEKPAIKIIFYDVSSTLQQCAFHTYQILKKFSTDIFNDYSKEIELYLVSKGFNSLSEQDQSLIDTKRFRSSSTSGRSDPNKISPSSASSSDNISKFMLPSATDPSSSFVFSLKKNQIQLTNAESLMKDYQFNPPVKEARTFPIWLKPYLDQETGLKKIIENFQKIELSENERIYFSIKTRQRSNSASSNASRSSKSSLNSPNDYILKGTESGFKNRYPNILPYEHSRVKLMPSPITPNPNSSSLQAPPSAQCGANMDNYFNTSLSVPNNSCYDSARMPSYDDYINANFITVPQVNPELNYIATQAPLPSTTKDFWRLCFHNNVQLIVSLTNLTEYGIKKSDIYWENSNDVELLEEHENFNDIKMLTYRKLKMTNRKRQTKIINQLQFLNWPDSGLLSHSDLLQIIKTKEQFVSKSSDSPILVHCSAGCGRTGVFITVDLLYKTFQKLMNAEDVGDLKATAFWNSNDDLINFIVEQLRKQRISMVQNLNQFIFCYEVLLQYFANLEL